MPRLWLRSAGDDEPLSSLRRSPCERGSPQTQSRGCSGEEAAVSDLKYIGTRELPDVLEREDGFEVWAIETHDCRTHIPDRTGAVRRKAIAGDVTHWVFDPMVQGTFLYIIRFCPWCGEEMPQEQKPS
jgi:hypothetical protein